MIDTALAKSWIFGRLTGDATLQGLIGSRVYDAIDMSGSNVYPYVIIAHMDPLDLLRGVGPVIIAGAGMYLVKAVGKTRSISGLVPIVQRVQALLHDQAGPAPMGGGQVLACTLESGVDYPELSDGVMYRHLGGVYRVYTQET